MLAWQLTGECPFDSTRKLDRNPEGTRSVNGPLTASATSSEPSQFAPSDTVIGPFCVCSRSLPLVPEKLIGPFSAEMSASPEQSFMLMGPFVARVVSLPFTLWKLTGPLWALTSTSAERGVRISRNTVPSSWSADGPLTETSPPCTESLICERSRCASLPTAALHAVTEQVSFSQPCT